MLSGSQILLAIAAIASVAVAHPHWNPFQPNYYPWGGRLPLPFPHHGYPDGPRIIIIEVVTGNGTSTTASATAGTTPSPVTGTTGTVAPTAGPTAATG
jgi:hypothetical protein